MSFTLRSLFLAFVVLAAAMGAFGPCGLFIGIAVVALVAFFRSATSPYVEGLVAALIVGFIVIVLLWPHVRTPREAVRRSQCVNNLKQIALALLNYENQHGCFPPAYVPGPDGKPWHSWRVLILPYLEEQALYAKYRFDEPWNGPNNRKVAASIRTPGVYVCPTSGDWQSRGGNTSYFAVVGPKTAWPEARQRRIHDIGDGAGNTILVMEVHGLGVNWMEPKDLDFDRIAGQTQPGEDPIGTLPHPRGRSFFYIVDGGVVNVAFADGHVQAIPWGLPGKTLAPLLTVDGGEAVDPDALPSSYHSRLDWPRIVSLVVLVLSTVLLWRSLRPRPGEERVS